MKSNDLKDLLVGHVKEQFDETLLFKRWKHSRIPAHTRPARSHLLVNLPTQEERRDVSTEVRP